MPTPRTLRDLTVIALDDGEGAFFEPRESAFPAATSQQWAQADRADPDSVRQGGWWLRFRCFAVRRPSGRVVLVDAGIGSATAPARAWAPVPGRLPAELAGAGIDVNDVDTVVLTHMHTDHIGWSMGESGEVTFPQADYLLQKTEVDAIEARAPNISQWLLAPLRASGQLQTVDGEHPLGDGVRIVATPGHTPGHQSVLIEAPDQTFLIAGDLLVHVLQLIDPSVGYTHEDDQDQARATRMGLLGALSQRGRFVLATAHLGDPFLAFPPGSSADAASPAGDLDVVRPDSGRGARRWLRRKR